MRIFLKIFLSFWITLILVAASLAWAGFQLRGKIEAQLHEEMESMREEEGRLATLLQREGPLVVAEALDASPFRASIYVIDARGGELLGREGPDGRLPPGVAPHPREGPGRPPDWRTVTAPGGEVYRVELRPGRPPVLRILFSDPLPPTLALLVSGVVVLLLARHFTRPIHRLRAAARRLAEGELDARAGPVRRRVPDELADLEQDFDRMAARLQGVVESHKGLLRDVSHELRSPLARLRTALGLAEQKGSGAGEELARMEQEVERLDAMIGQILTLARLDAGEAVSRESWVDLRTLVEAVVADAAYEARSLGKLIALQGDGTALLRADDRLLWSAIENVVRNAVRHTAPGTAVRVRLLPGGGWVVVEIADQGPGVPEAELVRIFEPFLRVGEARDRDSGGYGLGLAIAARAVHAHGGSIAAANHPLGGLVVTIGLPVEEGEGDLSDSA